MWQQDNGWLSEPGYAEPPRRAEWSVPERPRVAVPVVVGCVIAVVFFGGFVGWSAFARLSSAAIAQGTVKVESNRKTVQHLEGGIVSRILVAEGQVVASGQELIELEQTKVKARISLLKGQIAANQRQLQLLGEEIESVESLLQRGLASKPRLLGLQRRVAELEGDLKRVQAEMIDAEDTLRRSMIRAPISGTVVGLAVHTLGGVIAAGEKLMDIVPSDERLIVEANVDPNDIDVIHGGLDAEVYLTAYSRRSVTPIKGRVLSVSADQITDARTGQGYFLARVVLTEDPAEVFPEAALYPGMPAEVMIVAGDTTLLNFMIEPFVRSFNRAFREK